MQTAKQTPSNNPSNPAAPRKVVCFGDSITRGLVSANYVKLLEQRLGKDGFQFINAGINGDHSDNLLRRIRRVIRLQPDVIVILIGTNDINADINLLLHLTSFVVKGILRRPSPETYRHNMTRILQELQEKTDAALVLASPPLIGENLSSNGNQRARQYCTVLKELAAQFNAAYLPIHEIMEDALQKAGFDHGGEYRMSLFRSMELLACHLLLGESYESISRRRGFMLVTDGIHLNEPGAAIVASQIEAYLLDRKTQVI